jgi:hypothetical protein
MNALTRQPTRSRRAIPGRAVRANRERLRLATIRASGERGSGPGAARIAGVRGPPSLRCPSCIEAARKRQPRA